MAPHENDEAANPQTEGGDADASPRTRSTRRAFIGAAGAAGVTAAAVVATPSVAGALEERRAGRGDRPDGDDGRRRGDGDGRRGNRDRGDADETTPSNSLNTVQNDGPDRFSRMFDRNDINRGEGDEMREALAELSRPGGILDANDPLDVGPIRLITEPELSPNNLDNPRLSAGNTFVGQFLDHDITRDAGSRLGRPVSLQRSTNLRTARFDLDSVYGGGPGEMPDLYDDDLRFVVESGGLFEDVPRDGNVAIIADPRNDENLIISGLQAGFLLFHNAVMDRVEAGGSNGEQAFAEAQQLVRWHYQWMVLHEYLPGIVGADLVNDVLENGRRFYTPDRPLIPVEFQTSAFRFGHSQVRPSYRANLAGDSGEPFFALVFDPDTFGQDDPEDLTGGHRSPRRFIGWQTFFDFGDGEVKNNKLINPSISTPLFRLPAMSIPTVRGEELGPTSLATRNLLRHLTWQVATGQQVAEAMSVDRLSAGDLSLFGDFGANLDTQTPLWLYILQEAQVVADGQTLGPVGGRIVAEVFIGLLQMDSASILNLDSWTPSLPNRNGADAFGMADILAIAGVDPDSRGQ